MHKVFFILLGLLLSRTAYAQVDELENPGTVNAIQDRAYRMQHELDLTVGVLPLDAFTKTLFGQVAYVYHFTDSFAWQVGRGAYGYSADTGIRSQLQRDYGVLPTAFDEISWFVGSDLMWKPFYGKVSVMNKAVIHGEFFLELGGTVFKYTKAFRPGINVGGGGRIFISKYASVRLDVTDNVVLSNNNNTTTVSNVMSLTLSLGINFGGTE